MIGVIDSLSPSPPVETLNIGGDRNSFVQTSELTCGICRKKKTYWKSWEMAVLQNFQFQNAVPILFFNFIRFVYLLIDSAFESTYQFFKNHFRFPRMLSDRFNQLCLKTNRFCRRRGEESRRRKADLSRKEVERSLLFSLSI